MYLPNSLLFSHICLTAIITSALDLLPLKPYYSSPNFFSIYFPNFKFIILSYVITLQFFSMFFLLSHKLWWLDLFSSSLAFIFSSIYFLKPCITTDILMALQYLSLLQVFHLLLLLFYVSFLHCYFHIQHTYFFTLSTSKSSSSPRSSSISSCVSPINNLQK